MRRLWRIAIGNWWGSPGRTTAVVLSVALGVGTVVIISNFFETARRGIAEEVVARWLGTAHISVFPVGSHWAQLDSSVVEPLSKLENVDHVTARLQRRVRLSPSGDSSSRSTESPKRPDQATDSAADGDLVPLPPRHTEEALWVDAIGIDPDTEEPFRTVPPVVGRRIGKGERRVAVMERETASQLGLRLGDSILLSTRGGDSRNEFTLIGLFDSRRIAEFQAPTVYLPIEDLQSLRGELGVISVVDLMLHDASMEAIERTKVAVEQVVQALHLPIPPRVETAAVRQVVLTEVDRVSRMLLMLIAFVALLTSFFIILTTQSVSLLQRRPQLGIMRCVGTTRAQLSALLFAELLPLGLIGTVLGLTGGTILTLVCARLASDVLLRVDYSGWGMILAVGSGLVTTLFSAAILTLQIGQVSPLEAISPQAKQGRKSVIWGVSLFGIALLGLHEWMVLQSEPSRWFGGPFATIGAASLHLGYAFVAPGIVVLAGRPFARGVGRLLRVRGRLAEEPFTRAAWRSTGACWVLMVGLSLIVQVAVRASIVTKMWEFPAKLPSAFVWASDYVSSDVIQRVRRLPGVSAGTTTTDVDCTVEPVHAGPRRSLNSLVERLLSKLTRPVFVAGEADELFQLMKVAFLCGTQKEAIQKLKRGGYVLIPPQTAKNLGITCGDRVRVTIRGRMADMEVAGIVQSPALDLAVTAFQAESYMQIAAASAVLGTQTDLRERFGLDIVSMFLCDIDLPSSPVPSSFRPENLPDPASDVAVARAVVEWADHLPNEREAVRNVKPVLTAWLAAQPRPALPNEASAIVYRFRRAVQRLIWSSRTNNRTRSENWDIFRERLVLERITQEMNRPDAITGSLRRLKQELDRGLNRAVVVVTWLPSILLIVAAVGIGNLMMVSVHQRARQIAMMRAVGAERSQVVRLVLAEAITLGLLGSVIGVALGVHEAHSVIHIASGLLGIVLAFGIPLGTVGLSVLLTVAVCVLAGIPPARHAARENIVSALQAT